jgi:sec-independent protein translocase protein TatC
MAGSNPAEMPFLEHLEELRWRLFKCAVAIFLGVTVSFVLLYAGKVDIVGFLVAPVKPYLGNERLIVTHVGELFQITMQAAVTLGLIAASPVIAWQIWGFLSPALYGHEKKVVIPALVAAALLFLAGMTLAYAYVMPVTYRFYMSFQSESVGTMQTVDRYLSMVYSTCLSFGAMFELPVVIALLSALGIVQPQYLSKFRRHAVVGCLIAAALITPGGDPTSLILLTIPLYFLYEASITISRIIARRREHRLAAEVA